MDAQVLSELHWIRVSLVVIAASLVVLSLVGMLVLLGIAQLSKHLGSRISFADQAKLMLDRDEPKKVIEACEARLVEHPADAETWWYLAQAAYRDLQLKRALQALEKVRDIRPDWTTIEQLAKVIEEQLAQQVPEPALHVVPPPMVLNVKPASPYAPKGASGETSADGELTPRPPG
jgi:cytochrome c-type biogenesis protein CcmH/NrfG